MNNVLIVALVAFNVAKCTPMDKTIIKLKLLIKLKFFVRLVIRS